MKYMLLYAIDTLLSLFFYDSSFYDNKGKMNSQKKKRKEKKNTHPILIFCNNNQNQNPMCFQLTIIKSKHNQAFYPNIEPKSFKLKIEIKNNPTPNSNQT